MHSRIVYYITIICLFYAGSALKAQRYQAIHGSPMAGSLGVANNPASIVHVPFAWDVTVFSLQDQHTTNAGRITNASLFNLKDPDFSIANGQKKRFFMGNQDVHLLNARIRLDSRQAIAFGINFRSAFSGSTSPVNWHDSVSGLRDFFDLNRNNLPLSAQARGSAWTEIFGTYARTLIDDGGAILNAGITLSVNRGIAGGFVNGSNLNYFRSADQGYLVGTADLQYGYAATMDKGEGGYSVKQTMQRSFSSFSANLGMEYIIPSAEGESSYEYDWKVGVSLLDLGSATYRYSPNSRFAVLNKDNISDSLLENTFRDVQSIEEANDSLASIAGSVTTPFGNFRIRHPSRLVINVDRHIQGNFFVNGELILPLVSLMSQDKLSIRDMNLLAVTPRYETRMIGAYLPVTFNREQQLWVGGALRAGPLLLGVHNWANLFAKNKLHRGGVYLALTFRPGSKRDDDNEARDPSGNRLSRKQRRYLDCPRF